jgi:hypothetical protein
MNYLEQKKRSETTPEKYRKTVLKLQYYSN